MFKSLSPLAAAGILLSLPFLGAAPALALSRVTFVSGKGNDTGSCASPAFPCRLFQFAFGQTSPGGEIKALDPAAYGPVAITNSISITGVEGASINHAFGVHITINAGINDTINLSDLTLDGFGTATNGIVFSTGGSLTISHCTVRNFSENGILLAAGLGTLDHVLAYNNGNGIKVGAGTALAVDSTAANNSNVGFLVVGGSSVLRLAHSAATGNVVGVRINGTAESAGDNFIRGNNADVFGTLTNVGTR
jgi:hypothetical protein